MCDWIFFSEECGFSEECSLVRSEECSLVRSEECGLARSELVKKTREGNWGNEKCSSRKE